MLHQVNGRLHKSTVASSEVDDRPAAAATAADALDILDYFDCIIVVVIRETMRQFKLTATEVVCLGMIYAEVSNCQN